MSRSQDTYLAPISLKQDRFRARKRVFETDEERNSRLKSIRGHKKDESNHRYGLVSADEYKINEPAIKKQQSRLYGVRRKTEENELHQIQKEAKRLEMELDEH